MSLELKEWRRKAHLVMDEYWRRAPEVNQKDRRRDLYRKLKILFGKEVHVATASIVVCQQIVQYVLTHPAFTCLPGRRRAEQAAEQVHISWIKSKKFGKIKSGGNHGLQ